MRFLMLFALCLGFIMAATDLRAEDKKPTPKFKLAKETTYVLGPVDEDGYVDYETAVNDMLKGKTTPDTNALVLLMKCFGPKPEGADLHPDFYKWLGVKSLPEDGDYLISSSKHFALEYRGANADQFHELESQLKRKPWQAKDYPRFVEWLQVNEKPISSAIAATKKPDYFHPVISRTPDGKRGMLIGALLSSVQKSREIAHLLSLRAMYYVGDGKPEAALQDALAMHRLGRLIGRGGFLIELLVGIAIDSIAHQTDLAILEYGKLTSQQIMAYQVELMNLAPMSTTGEKIAKYERCMYLDSLQGIARDGATALHMLEGMADGVLNIKDKNGEIQKSLDYEQIMRFGNTWYNKIDVALSKDTYTARNEAVAEYGQQLELMAINSRNQGWQEKALMLFGDPKKIREKVSARVAVIFVSLLIPSFQKVMQAGDRSEQISRNGLIATALAAYYADHKKYPVKLDDLKPKYIAKIPNDLFTEKALIYMPNKKGYLLYSVGVNGKDDGGKLISDEPRGDDVGVRIP